jgi:hypothetical protein
MRFDFIHEEMKKVAFPQFFHLEPLTKFERKRLDSLPQLPPSYVDFLTTFGKARFFRELDRDRHHLMIFPPPEKMNFYGDSYMMDVAHAGNTTVSFKFSELESGKEPPLYDIALGIAPASPRRRAESFMEWLVEAWDRRRRGYTKKAWATVVAGPTPFSAAEQRIVDIRRGFKWRQLPPKDGMVTIEFTNASDGRLSCYSIGVKRKHGGVFGGFRVKTDHIESGSTVIVYRPMGGYADQLTAESCVLFDQGEPKPETRSDFWEFRESEIEG